MHDLVIDNALLIDGTGAPARRGSLAVKDGRIAAVGETDGSTAQRVDAQGLELAPGIIDMHTHFDAQLIWDPFATPSVALGVTSMVIGNCGFTIAPCRPPDRNLTLRNLTHVEGIPLDALRVIQPLWALPLLRAARLDFRHIMGYAMLLFLVYVLIVSAAFFGDGIVLITGPRRRPGE